MYLRNPVAELEIAQHKVALSSWDPKMKELNPDSMEFLYKMSVDNEDLLISEGRTLTLINHQ